MPQSNIYLLGWSRFVEPVPWLDVWLFVAVPKWWFCSVRANGMWYVPDSKCLCFEMLKFCWIYKRIIMKTNMVTYPIV